MAGFSKWWFTTKRTICGQSARAPLADAWWRQVEQVDRFSMEDLAISGRVFEAYDYKICQALLEAIENGGSSPLERKLLRFERELDAQSRLMTGRMVGRLIWLSYSTDSVSRQQYNEDHLRELKYPGDDRLEEFMDLWYKILGDNRDTISETAKEKVFYRKIKNSTVLRPWLDYYVRLADDHKDHCYEFLASGIDSYLKRADLDDNDKDLGDINYGLSPKKREPKKPTGGADAAGGGKGGAGGDGEKHCPHWLRGYCRDVRACNLGKHLASMKGTAGAGKGGADGPAAPATLPGGAANAGKGKGKGDGKGKKGDKKGGAAGSAAHRSGTPTRSTTLAADATVDELGRPMCYKFFDDGTCKLGADCPRYHGLATDGMIAEKEERQAKWKQDRDAAAASGGEQPKPKAKAKAKA